MKAGGTAQVYELITQHTKRLAQSPTHQIREYEKKFGVIDAKWLPGIESPIQSEDIKGGGA